MRGKTALSLLVAAVLCLGGAAAGASAGASEGRVSGIPPLCC